MADALQAAAEGSKDSPCTLGLPVVPEVYTRVAKSEPETVTGLASKLVKFCLPWSKTWEYDSTGQARTS